MLNPNITPYQLGWLVGMLEGEGSFVTRPRQAAIQLTQVSSDKRNLDLILEYTQIGSVTGPHGPYGKNRQTIYTWQVGNYKDVYALCTLVQPLMSERRQKQIQKSLDFILLKDRKKSYAV